MLFDLFLLQFNCTNHVIAKRKQTKKKPHTAYHVTEKPRSSVNSSVPKILENFLKVTALPLNVTERRHVNVK